MALKEEVDRLAQPPSGFGIFLQANEDGSADVFTAGRKMRVSVSPGIELDDLKPGQKVVLNEALNVVIVQALTCGFSENEDLPKTASPDDWARISGKKGERIVYIRALVTWRP